MSDQRLREAERRFAETHAPGEEAALVAERLRAGLIDPERVALAAELGSAAASQVSGVAPARLQSPRELARWGERAARYGLEASARLVLADMHRLLAGCAREHELLARQDGAGAPLPDTEPGETRAGWLRTGRSWADLLEAWILGRGPREREGLLGCAPELSRASDETGLGLFLFRDLVSAARHTLERVNTETALTVWSYGPHERGPHYRWPGEPQASVWAAPAREVIPWALGHRDPLRVRVEELRVASPCPADWDAMRGDERARDCPRCQLTVWDLGGMTWSEARALVARREGRLCVRLYRRADGTLLTRDCPDWVRSRPDVEVLMGDLFGDV